MKEHKFISAYIEGLKLALEDYKTHEHLNLHKELQPQFDQGWDIENFKVVPRDQSGFWVMMHLIREAD